jgi:hypothetical protein
VLPTAVATPTPSATERLTEELDRSTFDRPTDVNNRWFPLVPGVQMIQKGRSEVDGKRKLHDVVFTVTDLVKDVDGVRSVVIHELDYTNGELIEAEIAFFAQDNSGTVWRLGEHPEEYEDGKFVEAPTWLSGLEGAKAGIAMKAVPDVRAPSYAQGWGPAVEWKDRGRVIKAGGKTCVPVRCYFDVLVIEEFSADEPDAFQLKYYASDVGNVRVGWAGAKEQEHEVLELVKNVRLDAQALAKVRQEVLAMEKHAYQVSKDVYGTTAPMQTAG